MIAQHKFDLIVNIPKDQTKRELTNGYRIRRDAIDHNIQMCIRDSFIPDPKQPDKYHPRISARCDYLYQTLSEEEKRAFDALYEDYYYHRHNEFWYGQAMRKLPVLVEATQMLVCAEDLGIDVYKRQGRMSPSCLIFILPLLRSVSVRIRPRRKDCHISTVR